MQLRSLTDDGHDCAQCFDSGRMDNTWASVPFGIYLSYDCSSQHRNFGVHVSFVQSVKLDKWSPQNVLKMVVGGNAKAKAFFRQHGYDGKVETDTLARYSGAVGKRYKKLIEQQSMEGPLVKRALDLLFNVGGPPAAEEDFFAAASNGTVEVSDEEKAAVIAAQRAVM